MIFHRPLSAACLLAFSTPALADLTAEEVLADQVRQFGFFGLLDVSVDGEKRSGDTLTIDSLSVTGGPEGDVVTFVIGGYSLVELDDGTVQIVYPDVLPLTFIAPDDADMDEISAQLKFTNPSSLASGSVERIRYDFSADKVSFEDLQIDGQGLDLGEDVNFDMEFEINGIRSTAETAAGDTHFQNLSQSIDSITMSGVFDEPEANSKGHMRFSLVDMQTEFETEFSIETIMTSVSQALLDGNRLSLSMSTGEYVQDIDITTPYDSTQMYSSSESTNANIRINKDGVLYEGKSFGTQASMSGSEIPFPQLTYNLPEVDFHLSGPLLPSNEPAPYAFRMGLIGFEFGEDIWQLFDPAAQLSRDPIDIVFDLDGLVTITEDWMNLEALEGMEQPPFKDPSFILNELRLSAVGAELTGTGTAEANMESDIPKGNANFDFMLTGGNALLDTLVGMGFIPEDQAMGARMMLALFARPGDGEDTLVSNIEVKDDGSIFANGQQIK